MNDLLGSRVGNGSIPTTPRKGKGRGVNAKLQAIGLEFSCPEICETSGQLQSPRQRSAGPQNLADKCVRWITFLFWKNEAALESILQQLREDLEEDAVEGGTLAHLVDLLADWVKLTKDSPDCKLEKSVASPSSRPFVNDRTRNSGSPTPQTGSPVIQAKIPGSLRQGTLLWQSAKPVKDRETKNVPEFAIPAQPSLRKKRPSEKALEEPTKHVCRDMDNRSVAQSRDPSRSSRGSLNTSFYSEASTLPTVRNSFASTNRAVHSFASTVPTSVTSDDDGFDSSDYEYGDINASQAEKLMTRFEEPVTSFNAKLRKLSSSYITGQISPSQRTIEDGEMESPVKLQRADSGTSEANAQLQKEHTASLLADHRGSVPSGPGSVTLQANLLHVDEPQMATPQKSEHSSTAVTINERYSKLSPHLLRAATSSGKKCTRQAQLNLLENHLVRDLPQHGLFADEASGKLLALSFDLRWECHRAARAMGITLQQLSEYPIDSIDSLYNVLTATSNKVHFFNRTSPLIWEGSRKSERPKDVVYKGMLTYDSEVSPRSIFSLDLQPLQIDRTSRLERKFGSHRFLHLSLPGIGSRELPPYLARQGPALTYRLLEWLCVEKRFLGCTWRAMHIEPLKGSKKKKQTERNQGYRVLFFATEGLGLTPVTLSQLLRWVIPFEQNFDQGYCKAYARLDLSLSRTTPSIAFTPKQIRFVEDVLADTQPDDESFNDPEVKFPRCHFARPVMNDGCSLMSVGAAKEICRLLGLTGNRPVTFQGRVNGCKGMWTISAPYDSTDIHHQSVWIDITNSQRKVRPRDEDMDEERCEEGRWTFESVKYGTAPGASKLYMDFMPILEDRGVPRDVLCSIVRNQLELDFEELYSSLDKPTRLRRWMHSQNSAFEEIARDTSIAWHGSWPEESAEKVILSLESGFNPKESLQLANDLKLYVSAWTAQLRKKLSIRLPKSTSVFGIADPTKTLLPGEIYLGFSEGFRDETTGECWPFLKGEVLVARHPSLRRSDIQKVKAVYKEGLSHLMNVVVFPAVGPFPLAGKLQGGDYDGDTFFITWEPQIVGPFKNAPAPTKSPKPGSFGIEVETRKLKDVMGPNLDVDTWLLKSFQFKLQDDLLGQVTNFYKKLAYQENSISGSNMNDVVDLHDVIIDSAKNGYTFTSEAFSKFKKKRKLREPAVPAYETLLTIHRKGLLKRGAKAVTPKYNPGHIIDNILFDVVNPRLEDMQEKLKQLLKDAETYDVDLTKLYQDTRSLNDPIIGEVLYNLLKAFDPVTSRWNSVMNKDAERDQEHVRDRIKKAQAYCYDTYSSLQPSQTDHPLVKSWLEPRLPYEPSTWVLLKASTFYYERHMKNQRLRNQGSKGRTSALAFFVCGKELCYLKAMSQSEGRVLTRSMYAISKPRKEREKNARYGRQATETAGQEVVRGAGVSFEETSGSDDDDLFDGLE